MCSCVWALRGYNIGFCFNNCRKSRKCKSCQERHGHAIKTQRSVKSFLSHRRRATEREWERESRKVSAFPACFNLSSLLSLSRSLLLLPFLFVLSMHQSINWFTSITKATHFLVGPRLHKMSHKSPWRLLLLSAYCFVHQILSWISWVTRIQYRRHTTPRTYLCLSGTARVSRPYYFYSQSRTFSYFSLWHLFICAKKKCGCFAGAPLYRVDKGEVRVVSTG